MKPSRANEIMVIAKQRANCFPWCELLDPKYGIITEEEHREVNEYWKTLPGWACYMTAFNKILRGEKDNEV